MEWVGYAERALLYSLEPVESGKFDEQTLGKLVALVRTRTDLLRRLCVLASRVVFQTPLVQRRAIWSPRSRLLDSEAFLVQGVAPSGWPACLVQLVGVSDADYALAILRVHPTRALCCVLHNCESCDSLFSFRGPSLDNLSWSLTDLGVQPGDTTVIQSPC